MTARALQVVIDCAHPAAVGAFWAEALGYVEEPPPDGFPSWPAALEAWGVPEEDRTAAYAVVDPAGLGPRLFLQRVPEGKTVKNRVHLDVRVSDRSLPIEERDAQLRAEVQRLEALGARRLEWRVEMGTGFMVMADVEGNEFCLT